MPSDEMIQDDKPIVQLSGEDGNVFAIVGRCSKALKQAGQAAKAQEMTARVMSSGSYDEALAIVSEYVDAR